jgi:hypothetical protein
MEPNHPVQLVPVQKPLDDECIIVNKRVVIVKLVAGADGRAISYRFLQEYCEMEPNHPIQLVPVQKPWDDECIIIARWSQT